MQNDELNLIKVTVFDDIGGPSVARIVGLLASGKSAIACGIAGLSGLSVIFAISFLVLVIAVSAK